MLLNKILMQIPVATPDTVAANKIKEATNVVTAHVDSLATQLHPDSIAAMTPAKIVDKFKSMSKESNNQADLLASVNEGVAKLSSDAVKVSDFTGFQYKSEKENEASMTEMVDNFKSITGLIANAQNLSTALTHESVSGSEEVKKTQTVITALRKCPSA